MLLRKNRNYTLAFKLNILKAIDQENLSLPETSLKFNIPDAAIIVKWKRSFANFGVQALEPKGRPKSMSDFKHKKLKSDPPLTREEELLLENERLRCENALLKKLQTLIQAEEQAIIKLRHKFDLDLLLNQTEMARSSFYYHKKTK